MLRRLTALLVLAAGAVMLTAPAADAHALLRSSEPASGALLDAAPGEVVVTFTERPDPGLSSVRVLDAAGKPVERRPSRVVASNPLQVAVAIGEIPKGVYTVTWRVVSLVDGHLTAGAFAFGVGVSPAGAPLPPDVTGEETPPPSAAAVAGRWLLYAGLAVLAGAVLSSLFVFRRPPGARWPLVAAWVAAALGMGMSVAAEASTIGISATRLLESDTGTGYVRQIVVLAVLGVLIGAVAVRPAPLVLAVAGGGVVALMIVHVIAGHAGGASSGVPQRVAGQAVHMLAASVWIGGLVWLVAGLRGSPGEEQAAAVRRFSSLAGIFIVLVALTGSFRALDLVGSAGRLFTTDYGRVLLVKLSIFAVIAALGALNRWRNVPALGSEPARFGALRKAVAVEIALAAAVFGATGAMTGLPPPKLVAASTERAAPAAVVVTGNDFATSVRVRLTATPGSPGQNTFEVRVADFDTGEAVPATRVALRFSLPSRPDVGAQVVEMTRVEAGVWREPSAAMAIRGMWTVAVIVEKPGGNVEVPLRVRTRPPPQDLRVARQPGQPTLYTVMLEAGRQVQAYLDPGEKTGKHALHFTFFDASGNELPVRSATMTGTPPDGDAGSLNVRRFGPGHFVATVTLTPGTWLFEVEAAAGNDSISAYFEQVIPR